MPEHGISIVSCGLIAAEHYLCSAAWHQYVWGLLPRQRIKSSDSPVTEMQVSQGSWYEPLAHAQGQLGGVVSNPPYIPQPNMAGLQVDSCMPPL